MHFTTPGPLNYAETEVLQRMDKASSLANDGELGASAIEWVIISAVMIVIVGFVGNLLYQKITAKATSLDLNVGP